MAVRDELEVDVLFVGAGPASLAGAILLRARARAQGLDPTVVVLEKAAAPGDHSLSGAVFDPRAFIELSREITWTTPPPFDAEVDADALWLLTGRGTFTAPFVPPALANRGKHVLSLNRFVAWLALEAQALGVEIFPSFAAREILWDGNRVAGVRVGDKGVGPDGAPLANYEQGPDIRAKVTVLGEGVRGTLSKIAIAKLALDLNAEPAVFALGIKELWQLPDARFAAGRVVHTLGYPLPQETFGGGWLYGMRENILDIGLVVGLDGPDPSTDAHDAFNRFKRHPAVERLLQGATLMSYGAKAIPEGGLFAIPRLYADGLLLVGDSAGFVNGLRLKGIHLAMKSGMLAAEAILKALQTERYDAGTLAHYDDAWRGSWAYAELYGARNVHQGFSRGLIAGLLNAGLGMISGGRGFGWIEKLPGKAGHSRMQKIAVREPRAEQVRSIPDDVITFGKLADVYRSGTRHNEHQPAHLLVADTSICADQCTREYGNPCRYFCPASVYHPEFTEKDGKVEGQLRIDFANCVHCKTCDIIDPYQIITWVPPEGGDGPVYTGM